MDTDSHSLVAQVAPEIPVNLTPGLTYAATLVFIAGVSLVWLGKQAIEVAKLWWAAQRENKIADSTALEGSWFAEALELDKQRIAALRERDECRELLRQERERVDELLDYIRSAGISLAGSEQWRHNQANPPQRPSPKNPKDSSQ